MRTIFSILTVLLSIIYLHSQNFAPLGAEWYYCEEEAFAPQGYEDYLYVTVTKDTVIQNKPCKELKCDWLCWSPSEKQYVYSNEDSVFLFDPLLGGFKLVYDFSAVAGDNIIIPIGDWEFGVIDTVILSIDSIQSIQINNVDLRKQFVTYHVNDSFPGGNQSFSYSSEIIETIGDINFIFNFPEEASRVCDANYSCGLRCYEDSFIGHYETGIAPTCTYTSVGLQEPFINQLRIYPNPTQNIVEMDIDRIQLNAIELYDINGRKVRTYSDSDKISFLGLSDGVYIIKAHGKSNIYYINRVIKNGS